MVFPNKTFYWPRHIAIALVLLTFINLLVIFAPNILGIFGIIGKLKHNVRRWCRSIDVLRSSARVHFVCFPGATSAPCLIFIFPAVFYIRIVPKEEEPLRSWPKILVSIIG